MKVSGGGLNSKRFLYVILGLFIAVSFQNCGLDILGPKQQTPSSKSLRGNGEPYVGNRPDPGTYYARKSGVSCEDGRSGAKLENVEAILRIDQGSETAEVVDTCSGESQNVSVGELETSAISRQYVSFGNKIYEQFENPPTADQPIPVLLCHYPSVRGFVGIDHVFLQVPGEGGRDSLMLVTRFALSAGVPQSLPPNPVTAATQAEYPPGVPGMRLTAQGLDLLLSGFTPDGVHHPSSFAGTVDGRAASGEGLCVDVQKMSQAP